MSRILLSLLVAAICKATVFDPFDGDVFFDDDLPDACRELCEAFSADRRGNGFDLCYGVVQSTCIGNSYDQITPYCDYLYWSVTDDGQPGIVYSVNGTDLSDDERERPVTCTEADQILSPLEIVYANTTNSPPQWSATSTSDEYIDNGSQ
jgi:hypothetical protein